MPRVSESELREVIEAGDTEKVTNYIDDAHLLVDETLGLAPGLSDERLRLIEKYLAAHLWVLSAEKGGLQSEAKGESSASYMASAGKGLSATRFGRLVLDLDYTGGLDKVLSGSARKAILRVV